LTRNGSGNDGRKIAEVSGAITPPIWTNLAVFLFCILVVRDFSQKWISKFFNHQRNHVLHIVCVGGGGGVFCLFSVAPMAYGGSQARGQIRAVATPQPQQCQVQPVP